MKLRGFSGCAMRTVPLLCTSMGCLFFTVTRVLLPLSPPPPLRTRGYIGSSDLGQSSWSGGWRVRLWTDRSAVQICLLLEHFDFPQSSHVCVTMHIQNPLLLIKKSRVLCPGGRFPPSFIHQVIIITGLNKLYDCMLSP